MTNENNDGKKDMVFQIDKIKEKAKENQEKKSKPVEVLITGTRQAVNEKFEGHFFLKLTKFDKACIMHAMQHINQILEANNKNKLIWTSDFQITSITKMDE